MRRLLFVFAAVVALMPQMPLRAQDYREQFYKAYDAYDFEKMNAVLQEWERVAPDANLYVDWYNYCAMRFTTDAQGKTDYSSLQPYMAKIYPAVERYPNRLDLRLILFSSLVGLERYEELVPTAQSLLEYDTKSGGQWLTYDDEPGTPERMGTAEEIVQELFSALYHYEVYDVALKMSQMFVAQRPNSATFRSDEAAALAATGDRVGALSRYLSLHAENPNDELVTSNVALLYQQMGDKDNAIKYYKLLEQSADEKVREQAAKALKELQ